MQAWRSLAVCPLLVEIGHSVGLDKKVSVFLAKHRKDLTLVELPARRTKCLPGSLTIAVPSLDPNFQLDR